jgi:alkylation response protein AidB-like acyl-CoA dehydrogenase
MDAGGEAEARGGDVMQAADDRQEALRMIRDSAAALAPRGGDLRRVRDLRFREPGFDPAAWRAMCEMGWPGLRVPVAEGGSGLGMLEFCALAEELGAGLVPEPLIQAALAARLLPEPHLARLLSGESLVLPAWQERADTLDPVGVTALRDGALRGRKLFVAMAAGADAFLVTVVGGLALVARDAPGLSISVAGTQDGGHFGTLAFEAVPAESTPVDAPEIIENALDEAVLATAAYLLGVMDRAFAMTLDYMKTRQQFGRPIGSFQSLQHRAADLKVQIALTRASVEAAATTLDQSAPRLVRKAAVSRAKARASDAAMLVTRQCVQLHGGIAYTDEYDMGLYLRKAMVLCNLYGSAALHRARFAAFSPEQDDE